MNLRPILMLVFAGVVLLQVAAKPSHQLKTVKELPKDLPKPIADSMGKTGYAISGPSGDLGTVWLTDKAEVKGGFQPTFTVKYPFQVGQLVGVLQVAKDASIKDFRGQELKAGSYTLRYGRQPEDGNHIGTSELADFLLAVPAKNDKMAKSLDPEKLVEQSAGAAGSAHPAIFSLLPAEKAGDAKLHHDEDKEFWILEATVGGKDKDKAVKVPVKMVIVGVSEA